MNWKVIAGVFSLILFLGVCVFLGGKLADDPALSEAGAQEPLSKSVSKKENTPTRTPAKTNRRSTAGADRQKRVAKGGLLKRPTLQVSTNSTLSAGEQKVLDALQLALDEEDFAKVRAAASALAKSASPEVRSKVVESLRWFKQKALPELRSMLSDTDEDVAQEASEGWLEAVNEMTDDQLKAKELYEGMTQMRDADLLQEAIMGYYDLDDGIAVGSLVQLIHSGNPVAEQIAREGYEHITGDPYSSDEAAQRWVEQWRAENPLENVAAAEPPPLGG